MTRKEALKFWEWRYENAKDYYDDHWEADERRSHREYVQALEWAVKALTDRKTENSSEIPNNCEHITEDGVTCAKYPACDDCPDNPLNKVKGSERLVKGSENPNNSTISKMEQVDEPQPPYDNCQSCLHWVHDGYWYCECNECRYEPKDEPQTQLTAKCLNCNNSKACKEKHWDGCVYEPKDEKTCETCRHWKYIAHEWQCEACKCQGYEPKDEPQTYVINPQEPTNDDKCFECDDFFTCDGQCDEVEDEPQTDCAWK